MLGLLRKDLLNLSGQLKIYAFFPIMALVLCIWQKDFSFTQMMMSILIIFVPLSAFAYDEMSNFNAYALTLPVTKKNIVNAKYLLSLILMILVITIACLIGVIVSALPLDLKVENWEEYIGIVVSVALIVNMLNCVMLPLMFQFGSEKSRVYLMIIFFGIGAIGYLLNSMELIDLSAFSNISAMTFTLGTLSIAFVVEVISLFISYNILERKEF